MRPGLGKMKTAMVIARLPLVSPVSDTGKLEEIEGWIIAQPSAEQADGDRGVFYHHDGNRIEITELSRYEKISGVRLLGFFTPSRPDPE